VETMTRKTFLMGTLAAGASVLLLGLSGCDQNGSGSSGSVSISGACNGCGECVRACGHGVLAMSGSVAVVQSQDSCNLCGHCVQACREGAITLSG